jgi:glycosyltransferase involved in cell wall biosynthesis
VDKPIVTVGIPVRNCEKTIISTLESVIHQDYSHELIRIVLVNDGCTDRTVQIANSILTGSKIALLIRNTGGRGLGTARQIIVDNAEGKYIVWLDGDAVLSPRYISDQVRYMESNPSIGKARGKWRTTEKSTLVYTLFFLDRLVASHHKNPEITGIGCSICRIDAIRDAGGFDINIKGAFEDVDLAIRMMNRGWKFSSNEPVFYDHPRGSWKEFFKKYFWYGYGGHYLSHKYPENFGFVFLPPVAIVRSVIRTLEAFKYTHKKISVFLPLMYIVSSFGWWLGYITAHFDKYFPKT